MGFIALVIGITGTSAVSAQQVTLMKANIPFEFSIGKKLFPAGEYTIKLPETSAAPTVSLRSADGKSYGLAMTTWVRSATPEGFGSLQFVEVDGNYYLYRVHVSGRDSGQQLAIPKKELKGELAEKRVGLKPAHS